MLGDALADLDATFACFYAEGVAGEEEKPSDGFVQGKGTRNDAWTRLIEFGIQLGSVEIRPGSGHVPNLGVCICGRPPQTRVLR